ncbi:hypothetical protein [Nocardioides sp. T2.26MG-1]|uniref:hypothetical protein n=1 Tax=Nocardioides sp. T2.26MG-1 TaxID=3041166 RepID=UPI002477302D|nr:hypothetical protein [Nocardioides sp. T2.26MG-1]CAI9402226.1 hypothetical protein HIDPHFAB_00772 [Nocardioides sp. T2.26MG-1]
MTAYDAHPDDPSDESARAADLGERLAAWLDELGLGPQLEAAGLPTYERDDHGRVRWTDPHTGLPMASVQLEDLERLLRSEGTDPQHAVPVQLVQLARQARLREELLASPWFTYETLAELRETSVDATRFAVHKAGGEHRLLVVAADERTLVPGFQLTGRGELRPELGPVIEPLLAARMDPWKAWAWLTQPAGLLGGLVPEQAAADPETADLVHHAAVRLAERVSPGR